MTQKNLLKRIRESLYQSCQFFSSHFFPAFSPIKLSLFWIFIPFENKSFKKTLPY